ncbi:MAG: sugar phosphate isomerase/epimerase [Candidatus Hydrogenedentes bacterium]|nr:sugar phosphate isomerase/epimerase [Candidatus Hydrogenedentota bacterium]
MASTRRTFLSELLASSLAPLLSFAAAGAANGGRWKLGLGLNGFMSSAQRYKKEYPLWEILDFAAREGFEGIELVDGWPMGGYPRAEEEARVGALRRLYDQYGLRIYTFQTGGAGAHAADPEARAAWLEQMTERIVLAKLLGCDFIGHWPGGGLEGNANAEEALGHLVSSYRAFAERCAESGLHFSFEIEPPFIFNTPGQLLRILDEVDHPACKTNYDPSHFDLMAGSTGKTEPLLRRVGVERIGHVHLTDTDGTLFGGTSRHLACGEGHCDLAASLSVLRDGGYNGWIMIDAWMIEDVYHAALAGRDMVRR